MPLEGQAAWAGAQLCNSALAARKKSLAMSGGKRYKGFWFSSKRDLAITGIMANGCIPE